MALINAQTVIEMSLLDARMRDAIQYQQSIMRARNYYNGIQTVFLTARMREYLNLPSKKAGTQALLASMVGYPITTASVVDDFNLNIIQTIVIAVLDELSVIGFDTSEPPDDDGVKLQTAWARQVWDYNRMNLRQHKVHEGALRDKESFVMVDWDKESKMPTLTYHEYYIDTEAGGDGCGCVLVRENDDPNGEILAAIKQWPAHEMRNGKRVDFLRRNVYYPDRIEKFYTDPDWKHYEVPGETWPAPWKNAKGEPLGVPVISFENFGGIPEAWAALNQQDAINKVLLDVLAEADGAFRMFFATGTYGTTDGKPAAKDGSNAISVSPMSLVGIPSPDAKVTPVDGGDPTKLMGTLKDLILLVAQITGTPVSNFIVTAQVAAASTLKGQDKPLSKKVEKRKDIFGQSWMDVMSMARRVANTFGNAGLDETVSFYTIWKQVFDLETIKTMRDTLGLPKETLWRMYGLSEEQIAAAKETDEYKTEKVLSVWETWSKLEGGAISLEMFLSSCGFSPDEVAMLEVMRKGKQMIDKTSGAL